MDKHEETRTWLRFFKDAGIPKKTGASYAHIFVENRIHRDMLSELTVDYLRLMGITLMGDIIAIMRHCKSVHQDSVRKVVILQSKDEPRKMSISSSSSSAESSSEDDDVEIVEVTKASTKKCQAPTKTTIVKQEVLKNTEVKQMKSQVVSKAVPSRAVTISGENKSPVEPVKRITEEDTDPFGQEAPTSRAGSSSDSVRSVFVSPITSPPLKKTRVTEESLPLKRVLDQSDVFGPKLPPLKKTVFERLGAETEPPQVSSTTELSPVETKFTRIITSVKLPSSRSTMLADDSLDYKTNSVFKRLGFSEEKVKSKSLPYAGILKSPPTIKRHHIHTKPLKIVRGTMRADEAEVSVKLRAAPLVKAALDVPRGKLKTSLLRQKSLNVGSQGILGNSSPLTSVSVKQRLGLSTGEVSSTSSIKERLMRSPTMKTASTRFGSDSFLRPKLDTKRISFGKTERKLLHPVGALRSTSFGSISVKERLGIHGRLGKAR